MGRKRLPNQFGKISDRIFKKLSSKQRQPIAIYNNSFKQLEKIEDELDGYNIIVDELKKKREKVRRRCEKIYTENKDLLEDYLPKYNVSKNDKKTKNGYSRYWMINLKYKGETKPIYIGNDSKTKELIKNEKFLRETFTDINFDKLSEDDIRVCIETLVSESLEDLVIEKRLKGENLLSNTIKFTDLI